MRRIWPGCTLSSPLQRHFARNFEVVETFLNLIWSVIALGAFAVWRCRWLPSRLAPRSRALPELVALVCALALLFPSISLTDDLHPVVVAVDASSGKRNGSPLLTGASHGDRAASKAAVHAPAVLASGALLTSIVSTRLLTFDENSRPPAASRDYRGRSPPSRPV